MEGWERLFEETLAGLKESGEAFWEKLEDEHRGIMEVAAKDLAKAQWNIIRGENVEVNKENIKFIRSTITTETFLASLNARDFLVKAFQDGLKKLMGVGLSILL